MAFRIGFKTLADSIDGGFLANAGENILQRAARGMVIQHLVGRQQRHAGGCGHALEPPKTPLVVAAVQKARRKPHPVRAAALQLTEDLKRLLRLEAMRRHHSGSGLSVMSLTAATASLLDTSNQEKNISMNREVRAMTVTAFERAGYKVAKSDANFIFATRRFTSGG